jgi:hypothetical protein
MVAVLGLFGLLPNPLPDDHIPDEIEHPDVDGRNDDCDETTPVD